MKHPKTIKAGHSISRDIILGTASEIIVAMLGVTATILVPNEQARTIVVVITLVIAFGIMLLLFYLRFFRRLVALAIGFKVRCEHLHDLAHDCRDLIIQCGQHVAPYTPPPLKAGEKIPLPHPGLIKHEAKIQKMLNDVQSLFQQLAPPGAVVFAALRDRRADDCYHTFIRAGTYDRARQLNSKALHKDKSIIVKKLRASFKKESCVIITGSALGNDWWDPQTNDKFGQDKSVMMGVVMTRSCLPSGFFDNNKHAWILTVSSDKEDVFHEVHIPLMKACNDLFSVVANVIIRSN